MLGDPLTLVMLVAGQSFVVSGRTGEIQAGSPRGVFVADVRVLSRLEVRVAGQPLEPLAVHQDSDADATLVSRVRLADQPPLLVVRRRTIGDGFQERFEIRRHGPHRFAGVVDVRLAADFADVFSVKEGRARVDGERSVTLEDTTTLRFDWRCEDAHRAVRLRCASEASDGATAQLVLGHEGLTWQLDLPAGASATLTCELDPHGADAASAPSAEGPPARHVVRRAEWRHQAMRARTDHDALAASLTRSVSDLDALRLFDPAGTRLPVVAAGAPWFMTLFGRDSLLTSLMALPVDPTLALGVLQALAELQGERTDPRTEEEPGRIMHETRFDAASALALDAGSTYYGSVDATPLFVVLLGELWRWGLPDDELAALLPHADRALTWIEEFGDRDGDGYVEYQRATSRGLANQGWKDSWDAVRFADGTVAEAPIALCEVQGYVYAAHRARAAIARHQGDTGVASRHERRAAEMKEAFGRDFWLPERGALAMALDRDKRPVDGLASNMGHCLWSGIVDDAHVPGVVAHLCGPELWSGWGIRTMGCGEAGYDPLSYHCGAVWPHDTALAVAGLVRAGAIEQAHRIVLGLLDAAATSGGRLPELFAGLDRGDVGSPVPYPTSCSPQAWSAASPLLVLRALLRLEPDVPAGVVHLAPALPEAFGWVELQGVRLWNGRFDLCAQGTATLDAGALPDGLRWAARRGS